MHSVEIMGVLNVTPDSFYTGSRVLSASEAIARGLTMIEEGADWLDIGGMSTSRFRNGSTVKDGTEVSEKEEIERVVPVIEGLAGKIRLSIDTIRPRVAEAAIRAGADMINDIQGFRDPEMRAVAAKCSAKLCAMHMKGDYISMQRDTSYPGGVVACVVEWARETAEQLMAVGVDRGRIVLDPGICFGKSLEDNYALLRGLPQLTGLGYPVLVGLSRKSLMGLLLKKPADQLLPATLALNSAAALAGASILRVHDVAAHRDAVKVLQAYRG